MSPPSDRAVAMIFSMRTRALGAGAVGAVALAVAGCGSSAHVSRVSAGTDQVGTTAIARAADVSGAAQGERVQYSLVSRLPTLGAVTVTGTGTFDSAPAAGALSMRVSVPGASSLGATAASVFSRLDLEVILDRSSLYLHLPSSISRLASSYTGGKPWVSVDLSKLASGSGVPGLSRLLAGHTGAVDPSQVFTMLEAASSHGVTRVGTPRVNGIPTTEYHGTLDLAKLSDRLPASLRAVMRARLNHASAGMSTPQLPFTVDIDSARLVRRITLAVTGTGSGGQRTAAQMTLTFLAYGHQAVPAPPAAAQTDNLDALISSWKRHASGATPGWSGSPFAG